MGLNQVSRDHQPVTQEEICRTESPKTSSRGKASAADLLALALSFILLVLAACATDGSPDEEGKEAGVPALGLEEGRNGSPHPTLTPTATPTAPAVGQGGRDKIPSARSTPPDPAVGQDGATRPAPTSPTAIPVIAAGGAAEGRVRGQVLLEGLYSSSDVTIEVTRGTGHGEGRGGGRGFGSSLGARLHPGWAYSGYGAGGKHTGHPRWSPFRDAIGYSDSSQRV